LLIFHGNEGHRGASLQEIDRARDIADRNVNECPWRVLDIGLAGCEQQDGDPARRL